uniref:aminotransferase-like domain-containing protein n=1 Tax=Halomonas sp. TaxID=1486246 RepID=UPI0026217B3D|nr:PLP-dependent aminotransferase family protein [Halomonas sp.]
MSRAGKVADSILKAIDEGRLQPGARVASIREAARQFGVSKNTIIDAYDRLTAMGYLEAKRGSGFFVSRPKSLKVVEKTEYVSEAVDTVSLLREQLEGRFSVRAGDGRVPSSWTAGLELARRLRQRGGVHNDEVEIEYGQPQGYPALRELIAQTLVERSVHVSASQLLMTFGANHALDLIIRHFVAPGDSVLVESPGYYPLFGKLRLARARLVGVTRRHDGPDLDQLEEHIRQHRPRLFFLQPNAHNPTGTSMSLNNMHRLVNIANRHGVILVEDDIFADILPRATPRLAALDGLERVIYLGSFSKTMSTGLRCGFIAGSESLIKVLTDIKMLTVVNSSALTEMLVHDLMLRGRYRRHLKQLRERISKATATAVKELFATGLTDIQGSGGGLYLWAKLPLGMEAVSLAKRASQYGIFIAPGPLFSLGQDEGSDRAMRVNIAHAADHRLLEFLARELKYQG